MGDERGNQQKPKGDQRTDTQHRHRDGEADEEEQHGVPKQYILLEGNRHFAVKGNQHEFLLESEEGENHHCEGCQGPPQIGVRDGDDFTFEPVQQTVLAKGILYQQQNTPGSGEDIGSPYAAFDQTPPPPFDN